MLPHTEFFTRFVAYLNPSSPGPCQPTAGSGPGPCSLSARSNLITPNDPRARRAPVELVSAVTLPMRSLVPETVYGVGLPQCRLWETLPVSIVSGGGTCSELVPQGVDLSVVVVSVGAVAFVVEVGVAAAAAPDFGGIGGLNHSVMMWDTSVGSFGWQ